MIRAAALAAVAAVLAGCAGGAATSQTPLGQAEKVADRLVGQTRWVNRLSPVMLWDGPPESKTSIMGAGTGHPLKSGEFTVTAANHSGLLPGYMVRFKDGRTGYMSENDVKWSDDAKARAAIEVEAAECRRKGPVQIGMSREQVYASCWGRPSSINVTRTASGDFEQLVYGLGAYVYLSRGKVTAIQGSR